MSDTINTQGIAPGSLAFYDNYLPSVKDGVYTINASLSIDGIDTGQSLTNPITQDFEVRGLQFSLPQTEVHSVFPPANGTSNYGQFLPHIVLNKRAIPWERNFDPNDTSKPWVCLLVFAEGEIELDPSTNSALHTQSVSDFLAPDNAVVKPDIRTASVPHDVLSSNCSSIVINKEMFEALVPRVDELKYLTHVRQVNIQDQAILDIDDKGWFSVIAGNRLLKVHSNKPTRYHVHLVSLEGYYNLMNGSTQWPAKASHPEQPKDIALVSLHDWSFLSQPTRLNYEQLVEHLASQAGSDPNNLLLRRPIPSPGNGGTALKEVSDRLSNGYLPLTYCTESGEKTFSWYRGPLTPVVAQTLPRSGADYYYPSASSMMIYDPTNGIFDMSYAAAWSLGRALGLADSTFSQALMAYRKASFQLVGGLKDQLTLAGETSSEDLHEIVTSHTVLSAFDGLFHQELSSTIASLYEAPWEASEDPQSVETTTGVASASVKTTKQFLEEPNVQEMLQNEVHEDISPIANWLGKVQLLEGVPFNHLVPDPAALPVESLRFFYIDQNWLNSLTDGALSIGVQSTKDSFFRQIMKGVLDSAVEEEKLVMRAKIAGTASGDHEGDSTKEAMSGILIRSAIVSGWPGLVVEAFKGDRQSGTPLKLLRMDRLSPDVLLCIFLDIPDTIVIAEPPQGLCFGVEDNGGINLRKLSEQTGQPTGKTFPSTGGFQTFYRSANAGVGQFVLNLNDGSGSVIQTLETAPYLGQAIGPAQFALEMIKSPEEISFKNA